MHLGKKIVEGSDRAFFYLRVTLLRLVDKGHGFVALVNLQQARAFAVEIGSHGAEKSR